MFVLITDTHLKETNIEENIEVFSKLIEYCKTNSIFEIIHLGDVFDSREAQPLIVLKTFKDILKRLFDNNISIRVIPGNHDKTDYSSPDSFLDVFESDCFTLHKEYFKYIYDSDTIFHLLPFFHEKNGEYIKRLKSISANKNAKNILLTHIGVKELEIKGERISSDQIRNLFGKFDMVISGHYHNNEQIQNINYVGSTIPHSFGDKGDPYFLIYDDIEFIRKDNIFDVPTYKTIKLETKDNPIEDLLRVIKDNPIEGKKRIKIQIWGDSEKIATINFQEFKEQGYEIIDYSSRKLVENDEGEVIISENYTEDDFKDFASKMSIDKNISKFLKNRLFNE